MLSRYLILTLLISLLSACQQYSNGGSSLNRPTKTTNQIAQTNLRLGTAYMSQGDYERALEKLQTALKADPNYYATLNVLGVLHQRMGRNADAEQYFKKALKPFPDEPLTLNNYGQFLCSQGRFVEAIDSFVKAAENPLYDNPAVAYSNAGTCSLNSGALEQAKSYFQQALERNPNLSFALIQMADLSLQANNSLSARAFLQRYHAVAEHSPRSLWLAVQVESNLKDMDRASSYALLLKNKFPSSLEAQTAIERGY